MNILVVDDERPAIRQMEGVLKKIVPDAVVKQANKAKDALQLFREDMFDVVFLDISMPGQDGLTLAKQFREIRQDINIVVVTAFPQYALDAFRIYASAYILKPAMEDEVREVFFNLRNPVERTIKGLYARCFGRFDVFYDGKPVQFKRTKAKELFAYLIDKNGGSATNEELRTVLWEDDAEKKKNYLSQCSRDLRLRLEELGCGDVLMQKRDFYAIDVEKFSCDYYRALSENSFKEHVYWTYMEQYGWAENTRLLLEQRIKQSGAKQK